MADLVVVAPPPNTVTISSPGTQGPPGGGSATGTGFVHVTGGVVDGAARAVDLATGDVTGVLGVAHLPLLAGDVNGSYTSNHVDTLTGVAGVVNLPIGNKLTSTGGGNVGDIITTVAAVSLQFGTVTPPTIYVGGTARGVAIQNGSGRLELRALNTEEIWVGTTVATNFKFVVNNTSVNGAFLLDADIGTFSASGFIRTKYYAGAQTIWAGRSTAGLDANILVQNGGSLTIGDSGAANGWTLNLYAYSGTIQSRNTWTNYIVAGQTMAWAEFNSGLSNLSLLYAVAGGTTTLSFGKDILPLITQSAATTDVATKEIVIQSQTPFAGATTATNKTPGSLVMAFPAIVAGGNDPSWIIRYSGTDYYTINPHPAAPGVIVQTPTNYLFQMTSGPHGSITLASSYTTIVTALGGELRLQWNTAAQWGTVDSAGFKLAVSSSGTAPLYMFDFSTTSIFHFGVTAASATIQYDAKTTDVATTFFTLKGQDAWASATGTNRNGGDIRIRGGATVGGQIPGGVHLAIDTIVMIEAHQVVAGNSFVALCRGSNLTSTEMPSGTGDKVIYIGNAGTVPTVNPVSGGILYCDAGALKYRSPNGTVTTLGVL